MTVLTKPTSGGTNAPPETAMMSNPDISLARVGIFSKANEKITGNILPAPKPMIKMQTNAIL